MGSLGASKFWLESFQWKLNLKRRRFIATTNFGFIRKKIALNFNLRF